VLDTFATETTTTVSQQSHNEPKINRFSTKKTEREIFNGTPRKTAGTTADLLSRRADKN